MVKVKARITDCSFRYASPCLWNQLPVSLRQPITDFSVSDLPILAPVSFSPIDSPLSLSITPSEHICLWPPYGIGQAIIFLPCDFYLVSSFDNRKKTF